jgi:hypothetical protein
MRMRLGMPVSAHTRRPAVRTRPGQLWANAPELDTLKIEHIEVARPLLLLEIKFRRDNICRRMNVFETEQLTKTIGCCWCSFTQPTSQNS